MFSNGNMNKSPKTRTFYTIEMYKIAFNKNGF